MMMKKLSAMLILALVCQVTFAQNWGKDPETSKTKYALLSDKYKAKDFAGTVEPLEWILTNVPDMHVSVYKWGEAIYTSLEKEEKDEAKKNALEDKVLSLLDQRIKYFGEEILVLERKGNYAYNFLKDRKDKDHYPALDSLYSKIFASIKDKMPRHQFIMYMAVLAKQKKAGVYNDDQITEKYEAIIEVIEANVKKGEEADKWTETQNKIDEIYGSLVKVDCEFLKARVVPKFNANKTDMKLAKKIFKGMVAGKCTDEPAFLEAAIAIFGQEPDLTIGTLIAKKHLAANEDNKALEWYEKVVKLADKDNAKRADILLDMAKIYNGKGDKSGAREYAFKAAEADGSVRSEAYSLVATLYMNSASSCKGTNPVEQRYCFLAAYDMYERAGNSKGMANAQAQFPAMSDIFTYMNDKLGQSVSVGCWIGGTTVLRKRP